MHTSKNYNFYLLDKRKYKTIISTKGVFKMKKESVLRIVEACVLLVLGVLFCVSTAVAVNFLSIVIGVGLIAGGTALIVISLVKDKSLFNNFGLGGALILTLGIFFIARDALGFLFSITPFLLIVLGSLFVIEAFLSYFANNNKNKGLFVVRLIVGIAFATVGILLLTIPEFANWVGLIIGIAFILIALAAIISEFNKAKN